MIFKEMLGLAEPMIAKIHAHPFNLELAKGTLPRDTFAAYLLQDALYLSDFSRALALVAARLPKYHQVQQFLKFALDAIAAEQDLHANYLEKYQLAEITEKTPTCFMYTHYLLHMANFAPVEEAAASLLPCFFIYYDVGKAMLASLTPEHPYADWISLYSGGAFEASVEAAIKITNELAVDASTQTQHNMKHAFLRATQLEWMFWESAYAHHTWPI